MNKTVEQQLQEANDLVAKLLHLIGDETLLFHLQASFAEDLYDLDKDIEDEQDFANENREGAYRSAGDEARKRVRYLKKVRKEQVKLQGMLMRLISQRNKVQKELIG